jgi:hypothetical protein
MVSKTAPAFMDFVFNETFKILWGTAIFFSFYFISYQFFKTENFISNLSILICFNIVAILFAYICSFITIKMLLYRRYTNRGFFTLNKMLDSDKALYEIIMIFLNSIGSASMVISLLNDSSNSIIIFFGNWFLYKLVIAVLSYFIALAVKKNVLALLTFLAVFVTFTLLGVSLIINN